MRPPHHPLAGSLTRRLVAAALCALLAAQWLALLHGASGHGRHGAASAVAAAPAPGWIGALQAAVSAHDDGSLLCQALDHCLQGGPTGAIAAAPCVPPAVQGMPAAATAAAFTAPLSAYRARAPPAIVPLHFA